MRRRRSIFIFLSLLPLVTCQTYDAVPIGRPYLRPIPSPRQEEGPAPTIDARGYQPPPRPSQFQPPRSYPTFRQPSLNLDARPRHIQSPRFNWQMQQLQEQHPQRFQQQQLPPLPHNNFRAGAPAHAPQLPNRGSQIRLPTRKQTQVNPADFRNAQLDPVNNIIIHLYLNAKDRMSHTEIKTPVHGLFGIGTSHGGPGTHSDPIVITKDFDRDTLEFVEGQSAQNPSNIIEVKATVSTPNRQLENTVNKAVNMELDKAIPKVMDRMRGSTMTMDNGMRKELEEALVDELAKNLGETIDSTDITEEDLSKLIEEGFDEVTRQDSSTTTTTTTRRPTTTVRVVVTTKPTTTTTTSTTTTTTTRRPTTTTTTTTTTPRPTTTSTSTTTEWSNLVTEQNNDDDYFTEDSEDISLTSSTTRQVVIITTTPRPTPPPTTTTTGTTTVYTRPTDGHVHVMPGIRVTETPTTTTTQPTTTTTTTTTERPTTASTTTTTTTTTQAPTTTTINQWVPPPTTTTRPPYKPPTPVTFPEESEEQVVTRAPSHSISSIPTRQPLIEVQPSRGPHRGGVVSLDSNEEGEDYGSTATTHAVFATDRPTTSLFNLPTKSGPTLHPSTFSPPLKKPHLTSSEEIQPNFVVPSGPCPTPNVPSDRNRTDVLFLLDSSDNFTEEKFHRAIELIGKTVGQFDNFGPDGVQVSLVQYNDEPYLEFSLRKHNCKKHLLDDIADTEYMTGGSQLNKALEKVSQFAFTKKRGDRPDAENVLIIVTDGQNDGRVQQPTRLAKENNVTVLVISTFEANQQFVKELAGNKENNLFGLEEDLAAKLAKRIGEASSPSSPSNRPPITGSLTPVHPDGDDTDDNTLSTRRPTSEVDNDGIVHLECAGDGFKIQVAPPAGFRGVAVVKGYQDDVKCKATATSDGEVNMFISNEDCGVTQVKSMDPRGLNSSLVLHLLHDRNLNTGEDRAYLLQCFIGAPEDTELSTNLDVVKSELAIAETISLSTLPPTCAYSIRRDSPDGPVVTKAAVGQTVYHRWDCDGSNETTNAYGIQVHSCYASDDVERKFAFVDPRGCSSDLALLSDLTYAEDSLTAYAASNVFSVHNAESLKFVCKLSLCTRDGDGCEGVTPPACANTNKTDLLLTKRLTKSQNSAVDEALTSALTTKVGVDSGSADGIESFLRTASSSYVFWIVALVAVAAVVAISLLSRNVSETAETATTCSDPTSMSDSQDFGSIHSMHSPPNQQLADFMRTFDRNRYV